MKRNEMLDSLRKRLARLADVQETMQTKGFYMLSTMLHEERDRLRAILERSDDELETRHARESARGISVFLEAMGDADDERTRLVDEIENLEKQGKKRVKKDINGRPVGIELVEED